MASYQIDRRDFLGDRIIETAIALVDSAIHLKDFDFLHVQADLAENLALAMHDLAEEEDRLFGHPLGSAHVMLERVQMEEKKLAKERLIDKADQLALAIFDWAPEPGHHIVLPKEQQREYRFILSIAVANFQEARRDCSN